MRFALALVSLLLAGSAEAQDLRIMDPVVSVDGRRTATVGAPLTQRPFGVLTLRAPGVGTFTVGARPFEGARAAGQFDGDGLYFAGGGRSVRLRSAGPVLGDGSTRLAYVRFDAARSANDRGPVRLSVADASDGRGDRNSEPMPVVAERVLAPRRGPTPVQPARVSMETTRLRAETARLRADLDRLLAERQQLADQRARLATERDAALRAQAASDARLRDALAARSARDDRAQADLAERERRLGRAAQNAAELSRRLTQQRDALAAERDRLLSERNALIASRSASEAAREREAAAFRDVQARLERVEARRGNAPSSGELRTLRAQTDQLRARLVERDRTIETLRAERDDRTGQAAGVTASMAEVQVALGDARRDLAAARAERDAALADARAARAELDAATRARTASQTGLAALRAERDAAVAARDVAFGERDRLRTQLASRPDATAVSAEPTDVAALRTRLAAESDALAASRAELDREQRLLRAERAALSAIPRSGDAPDTDDLARLAELDARDADLTRREALVAEQEALQDDRTRLAEELAAARAEIAELRTQLGASRATPAPRTTAPPAETPRADGSVAYLPGFDFGRLANPDNVRRRLDEIRYPRWAETGRIEGDVLVLFQTDRDGTVIRTAVPSPLGGGLDALAEDLVRQMRFTPPTVEGQPAGLRSQVIVRFEL